MELEDSLNVGGFPRSHASGSRERLGDAKAWGCRCMADAMSTASVDWLTHLKV